MRHRLFGSARVSSALAIVGAIFIAGVATGATGGTFILGNANSATSQTSLTGNTSGNAMMVQNNGTGNGGVYVSNSATGIAGVTKTASRFALAGTNDGTAFSPSGGAISASGKNNHGVNASTQNVAADAVRGVNGSTAGTPSDTTYANGVYGETRHDIGNGVFGVANADEGEAWGVWGDSASIDGVGVAGTAVSGLAGYFIGDLVATGDVYGTSFTTTGTTVAALNDGAALAPGDAVVLVGAGQAPDGTYVVVVRRAAAGERVIGVANGALEFSPSARTDAWKVKRTDGPAADGAYVAVATGGVVAMPASAAVSVGAPVAATATGIAAVPETSEAPVGSMIGYAVGTTDDGRVLVYIDPH